MSDAAEDPIRRRRAQVARWTLLANRVGYVLLAVAVALFFAALITGFTSTMAVLVVVALVAACALLAPSIVLGYAVKAAEREDRRARPVSYPTVTMASRLTATARREQLLEVALGVFAQSGYHGTSMNDVADAAGVTKPVLYQHFQSKRELYQALLDEVGNRMLAAIRMATAGVSEGRRQTELGFRAYFRWVADDHAAFMLLYDSGTGLDEEFSKVRRGVTAAMVRAVAPLITADIDDDHRLTVAHALVGLAEGASRRLVEQGLDFDPDEVSRQVSELAWGGLRSVHRRS